MVYGIIWYIFTTISAGTTVPSGIFLPMIIVGCSVGQLYSFAFNALFPDSIEKGRGPVYSIIGSAAMLSGSTRMTYSIAVIIMETTQNLNLFLSIIFGMFFSYLVGTLFNRSIYDGILRMKNIPILKSDPPKETENHTAFQIMNHFVKSFKQIVSVKEVADYLKNTNHNGFPVVNNNNELQGIISRSILLAMIEGRCWYDAVDQSHKL